LLFAWEMVARATRRLSQVADALHQRARAIRDARSTRRRPMRIIHIRASIVVPLPMRAKAARGGLERVPAVECESPE
jgi:hypothetical protein